MKKLLILAMSILSLIGCGKNETKEEVNGMPKKVVFAESGTDVESLNKFDDFKNLMEGLLDVEIEYYSLDNRLIGTEAMISGQIDVLFTGPSEYIQVARELEGLQLLTGFERNNYTPAIIIQKEFAKANGINSLEDIKNIDGVVTIGMKDLGSTSGHIAPTAMLVEAGLDLERDVQILTDDITGSRFEYLYEDNNSHILGTGIKDWPQVQEERPGEYILLAEGAPLPPDAFLAGPHISTEFVDAFKTAFMDNQEAVLNELLKHEKNSKYDDARLLNLTHKDYQEVEAAYELLGL